MTDILADPERALSVAYAPTRTRPALATLFQLDERLGTIVGTTSEAMIGLMRLAWWREALERLDRAPAPAEPQLQAIAALLLPAGLSGATLAEIEDGWTALLDGPADAAAIARHGCERGAKLFACAARLLESDDPRVAPAGQGWALADLAHRHSEPAVRDEARRQARALLDLLPAGRWPKALRPLAALAVLAQGDVATDAPRRQGSPARLARMLAMRLTGR
ncbi:squalene/phytoene synthase family protein [Sphingomonas nostoxanthinifaciens]|uniref:squalene/phytoene synthase family protein n=1 Tax=Sphingomonas nostoxanthinifaciens TaxID=2872652 RepID=UPI001CC1DC06|nr:squalene/phytoene synthase family protein [Sphingomonas nostoxanthinifaciens]UAK25333.1 squalene/phytoene synthase family protein [Sphingomonas nostoxanthinifaciens]